MKWKIDIFLYVDLVTRSFEDYETYLFEQQLSMAPIYQCFDDVRTDNEVKNILDVLSFQLCQEIISLDHLTQLLAHLDLIVYNSDLHPVFIVASLKQSFHYLKSYLHVKQQLFILAISAWQQPNLINKRYLSELLHDEQVPDMRWIERSSIQSNILDIFHYLLMLIVLYQSYANHMQITILFIRLPLEHSTPF